MSPYHRPERVSDALSHAAADGITLAAGCTDLFAATPAQVLPGPVLDLTALAELRGINRTDRGWRIGATTTWSDIRRADLPGGFRGLQLAAAEVGGVQVQASGTIGGNLCNASPAADGVPPLLTMDASVELCSAGGVRVVPLADFILGPRRTALAAGEVLTAVLIPQSGAAGRGGFLKLGARRYLVISIAMVAVRITVQQGRIADASLSVGACGPRAVRLPGQAAALRGVPVAQAGQAIDRGLIAPALSPIDDLRADAAYRLDAAVELLRRALAQVTDQGEGAAAMVTG